MLPMTWRLPGLSTGISFPETLSTQLPPISICAGLRAAPTVAVLIATAIAISFLVELGVPNSLQPAYPCGLKR